MFRTTVIKSMNKEKLLPRVFNQHVLVQDGNMHYFESFANLRFVVFRLQVLYYKDLLLPAKR